MFGEAQPVAEGAPRTVRRRNSSPWRATSLTPADLHELGPRARRLMAEARLHAYSGSPLITPPTW